MTRTHGCSRLAGVRNRTRAAEGDCRSVCDTRASHPKPPCSLPSIRPPTRTSRNTARAVLVRLPASRPEQGVSEIDPLLSSTDASKVARGCLSRHQGLMSLESAPGTAGPVAPIARTLRTHWGLRRLTSLFLSTDLRSKQACCPQVSDLFWGTEVWAGRCSSILWHSRGSDLSLWRPEGCDWSRQERTAGGATSRRRWFPDREISN